MSDTDGKKPLGLGGAPRSGQVKQSFSHGRTKSVVVETKRKRVVAPPKPASAKTFSAACKISVSFCWRISLRRSGPGIIGEL